MPKTEESCCNNNVHNLIGFHCCSNSLIIGILEISKCVGEPLDRHLKEELAWTIYVDKLLQVIVLFKTASYTIKKLKNRA